MPSHAARRTVLGLTPLEDRAVPAALTAVLSNRVLTITGTDQAEKVAVFEDAGKVQVWWSNPGTLGLSNNKAFTGVDRLKIDVRGGNDVVGMNFGSFNGKTVKPCSKAAEIIGGDGDDDLTGGDGDDTVRGGAGADKLRRSGWFDTFTDDFNLSQPVVNGYAVTDIQQEVSPTCQTLAAIAEGVSQGYNFGANISGSGGNYKVKLPGYNKTVDVKFDGSYTTNDPFPTDGQKEFWPILLQRARLAALGVSFTQAKSDAAWDADADRVFKQTRRGLFDPADALTAFTGRAASQSSVSGVSISGLKASVERGDYVVAGSVGDSKKTLTSDLVVRHHAYAVLKVYSDGRVDLYNPWHVDCGNDGTKVGAAGSVGAQADDGKITLTWAAFQRSFSFLATARK